LHIANAIVIWRAFDRELATMTRRLVNRSILVTVFVAVCAVVMAPNAAAVVCSSVLTHTAFSEALPGGADNPVPDCTGSDTFLFTDAIANIESPVAVPVFEGADWFSDLHITLPAVTGGPTLVPLDGITSFFRNVTDATDWLASIDGLTMNFKAPSVTARVDPGDQYRWAVFFSDFVDESALPLDFRVAYTMTVPIPAPEPAPFALLGIAFAALQLTRKWPR
jgi:hypothetical protein